MVNLYIYKHINIFRKKDKYLNKKQKKTRKKTNSIILTTLVLIRYFKHNIVLHWPIIIILLRGQSE